MHYHACQHCGLPIHEYGRGWLHTGTGTFQCPGGHQAEPHVCPDLAGLRESIREELHAQALGDAHA